MYVCVLILVDLSAKDVEVLSRRGAIDDADVVRALGVATHPPRGEHEVLLPRHLRACQLTKSTN